MKDWWLRFGCFLTGYNYKIVRNCSEAAAKTVKKYTAAMLIVMIVWALVGYIFAEVYMGLQAFGAAVTSIVAVIIIVQIERQIILNIETSNWALGFRGAIALIMAAIGSMVIDQIIFKDDIDIEKSKQLGQLVNETTATRLELLNAEIESYQGQVDTLNIEKDMLLAELIAMPNIPSTQINEIPTPYKYPEIKQINGRDTLVEKSGMRMQKSTTIIEIPNPQWERVDGFDENITAINAQIDTLKQIKLKTRDAVELELKSKRGLLQELQALKTVVGKSWISMAVYLMWFLLFFFIELFVLVSKVSDRNSDYERTVQHQINTRIRAIEQL